jgi:hypothetical protein
MVWANMLICVGSARHVRWPKSQSNIDASQINHLRKNSCDMKLISGWPIDVRPETGAPVQLITGIEVLP